MLGFKSTVSAGVVIGLLTGTASAILNIETVQVGNPGNAADARYPDTYNGVLSYGAVGYTYNIGKYEVTAGQYTEFLNAVAKTDTYGLYSMYMDTAIYARGCDIKQTGSGGSYSYSVAPDRMNRPVSGVSWGNAVRFANWLQNGQPTGAQDASTTEDGSYALNGAVNDAALMAVTRKTNATWVIPSEDEWYKSAYHKNDGVTGNYFDYPMRSNTLPTYVLINPDPGNHATFYGRTIRSPYYRTVVGEHENSDSPYGTFDQGGNVWEWNESIHYGPARGLRGGAYNEEARTLHAAHRKPSYPTTDFDIFGFRVAQLPEPCSALMVMIGALGLASARRRG